MFEAAKIVLRERKYLAIFLVSIPIVGFLLLLIPVLTVPGNDLAFQLEIMLRDGDLWLIIPVLVLEALLVTMTWYTIARNYAAKNKMLGVMSAVPAFLFGMKACPLCFAAIFTAFGLGTGAVLPMLEYRILFYVVSVGIILLSMRSIARKIVHSERCATC